MNVQTAAGPLPVQARILNPPTLKYGVGSRQPTIVRSSRPLIYYSLTLMTVSRLLATAPGICKYSSYMLWAARD